MRNIDFYMSMISDRFEDSPAFDIADAVWLVILDKSAFCVDSLTSWASRHLTRAVDSNDEKT